MLTSVLLELTIADKLAQVYVANIVRLYGAPETIVFYRGPQFTSRF